MTVTELQDQIYEREGFRVSFDRFDAVRDVPPYGFIVMAPQGWRISDWKIARLGRYVTILRGVTVFGGDGEPVKRDLRLGHLRDSYYAAQYGSTAAPETSVLAPQVVNIDDARANRSPDRPRRPRR